MNLEKEWSKHSEMGDKSRYITGYEKIEGGYYEMPKQLFSERYKGLSLEAKFLYVVMRDLTNFSLKNNWIDENGYLYIMLSASKMARYAGCSERKAKDLKKELIEHNLIESVTPKIGLPSRLYILKVEVSEDSLTRAGFAHEPVQDLHTPSAGFAHEPVQDLHTINNNIINNNLSITNNQDSSTAVGGENNRQTTLIGADLSQSVGRPPGWSGIQSYLESQNLALSPKQISELEDFMEIDGLEKSLIEKAIDITAGETGSKRKYNYLKGILTNWKNGNIKTVADHEANEAERGNGKKKNPYIDEDEAKRMQEKYGF